LLRIENIKKSYGNKIALQIDELQIRPGEIVGLVGNNGAGKTTLFNAILDLIILDEGTIFSKKKDVSISEDWKAYTGSYISENFLLDFYTPDEYFRFVAGLRNINSTKLSQFLDQFDELFNNEIRGIKKYIRDLSKGNQKKTGIVAALIGNPELIILDEPFANLDPTTQMRLIDMVKHFSHEDRTILISSHDLSQVTDTSDRIILLESGLLIKDLKKTDETLVELEGYFKVL